MRRHLPLASIALTLLFTLAAPALAQQSAQRPASKPQSALRRVTVRLKEGDPVIGALVGLNGDAVQIEVAGSRLSISLDKIASLVFAGEAAATQPASGDAAREALKSLRKLASAVEVGLTYQSYSTRLLDVNAEVREALREVPEGEIKSEIDAALGAYADASVAWEKMSGTRFFTMLPDFEPGKTLAEKYSIEMRVVPPVPGVKNTGGKVMDGKTVLSTIWAAARAHVDRAEALYKQQQ